MGLVGGFVGEGAGVGEGAAGQLLMSALGYAMALPLTISATVKGMSSPQRAKLTKMRLERETVTPSGMGPLKVATVSRVPKVWSSGVEGRLAVREL